jgi:hypothetical protein
MAQPCIPKNAGKMPGGKPFTAKTNSKLLKTKEK